ncbi:MAG: hypothetical protein V1857_01110, partial [archaeon]
AQMDREQSTQDKTQTPKKKEKTGPAEKKQRGIDVPNVDDQKLISDIRKMGSLTPFAVSSQFNIRLGAAKDLLEELARRKVVEPAGGNARVRLYRAVAA